ncbi:ERVV2 protein, partial [Aphelocoma coerulescens]|nr:ERVV2 protein [Aphelocoma coerulescens]
VKEGGVCTVINRSCCSYVDLDKRIETDLQTILEKTRTLHQITLDDTSWGFKDVWDKFTSWLPNLYWLKQLFVTVICVITLLLSVCISSYCCMILCTWNLDAFAQRHKHKLRNKVEKGSYFKDM